MADEETDDIQPPVYDEDDEPEGGLFRWMSALVVLVAVAGFFGLAWYAYRNGGDAVDEKDVELVKADKAPVKEAPANPGGMQIPNQDKTVYGLISGKTEKPVVERILPAPEEPITRSGDTETWMSGNLKGKSTNDEESVKVASSGSSVSPDADTDTVAPAKQFNPAKIRSVSAPVTTVVASAFPNPSPVPPPVATVSAPSPTVSAPVSPSQSVSLKPASPAPVPPPSAAANTTPPADKKASLAVASGSKDADDNDDNKDAAKQQKTPVTPPAGERVQLGSYRSQAEAESNWIRIAHKFADDLQGRQHYVVRADLGGKGIYYRLQLAPFTSSVDAEEFCLDFVSAGQNCIVAKGK